MNKYKELAESVLEKVGGADNVDVALHCMTRLRFKLKDTDAADLDAVKSIKGVLGTQYAEGMLQVIVGPTARNVYNALIESSGLTAYAAVDETTESAAVPKSRLTPKGIASGVLNTFSACMIPLIPMFVTMGMMNVIAALIGPDFLGLVTKESHLYTNFYYVYQCVLYFLPVLLAISCSKIFKCSTMLSVVLAGMMLFPDMINALAAEGGYTLLGIAAPNVAYNGQVIPIMLSIWVLSYVERLFDKIIPNALKVIAVPVCTLTVMLPLTFCLLGPLGTRIGTALAGFVIWLYNVAGPVETTLVAAAIVFTTAFGIGRPIFFATLSILMSTGVEYTYLPIAMVYINWVVIGIAAGYLIKAVTHEQKELGVTCLVSSFLGGVSEPTLFGIILADRRTFIPAIVGGALSGLYSGIMKVGYYQFGPSNFMNVLGFMGGEGTANIMHGCIASGIGAVVAFVLMLIMYKPQKNN